jgi:hypothetical protein
MEKGCMEFRILGPLERTGLARVEPSVSSEMVS